MAGDDPFLAFVRYAPLVFVLGGVLTVFWLSRQRLPHEIEPDVLEALSDTEALSSRAIRDRPPLAHQDVDLRTLERILDEFCTTGRAVRWFEPAAARPVFVYRRIKSGPEDGGGVR
jgi:hypothetical protein